MKRAWNRWPGYAVLALVLTLMLIEWFRIVPASAITFPSFLELREELIRLTLDRTSQTCGVIVLCLYHLAFLWVKAGRRRVFFGGNLRLWRSLELGDWLKLIPFVCAAFRFVAGWHLIPVSGDRANLIAGFDQSTNALVLLAGIVLSQIVEELSTRNTQLRLSLAQTSFIVLVGFLAIVSLTQLDDSFKYTYRGERRASGLWVSPNTYGLLMGAGLVLSLACISQAYRLRPASQSSDEPERNDRSSVSTVITRNTKWISITLMLLSGAVAALFVASLLRSYSRGAWLATLAGLVYFCFQTTCSASRSNCEMRRISRLNNLLTWLRRNFWVGAVVCTSLLLIVTSRSMNTEQLLVRRAISAANVNDFSWRNRVAAWEGALQIMADHPFVGVGWHRISREFEYFYVPSKLAEHSSIIVNDYLTLGMALGIPALLCFAALIWISFRNPPTHRFERHWTVTASRSALIILLVGFWFDGGLFKLALAAPFWLFLELAIPRHLQPNEN